MQRKNGWCLAGFVFVGAWILWFLMESGAPALSAPPQDVLGLAESR